MLLIHERKRLRATCEQMERCNKLPV